eukprot:5961624-Karenia_brevis.AAC.1
MKTAKNTTIRTTIVSIKAANVIETTNNETTTITTEDASYDYCMIINFEVINLVHKDHIDHGARRVHDMVSESNMEVNSDKALKSNHTSICMEKLKETVKLETI